MLHIARKMLRGILRGARGVGSRGVVATKSSAVVMQQTTQTWAKLSLPPVAISAELSGSLVDGVTGQVKGKSNFSLEAAAQRIFEHGPPPPSLFSQGADPSLAARQAQNTVKS